VITARLKFSPFAPLTLKPNARKGEKMDIANISAAQVSQATNAAGIAVLKKALDIQEQSAQQLIAALPAVAANPPNLGQNVDIVA
jgi:hypothetical protein